MSEDRQAGPRAAAHSPAQPDAGDQSLLSAASTWVTGRVAPPPPREADDRVVTATITGGWAVALVVVGALAAGGVLPTGERWWVWTCAAGLCLGLFGLWYVPVLKHTRASAAARRPQPSAEPSSESRESGSNTVSSTDTPGKSTRS